MGKTLTAGVCLLAILTAGEAGAARHASLKCADPGEVSALQTAAVQQELMDAALGCGQQSMQNFNAFQTAFAGELRKSDRTLLAMFKRVYGPSKGDAAYNLFKTNMASKAEIRRVRGFGDFCSAADLVFAAALGPQKPSLSDFVAGVPIHDVDDSGVGKCDIQVAMTLQGTMAAPNIVPTPNPLRVAVAEPVDRTPASLTMLPPPPTVAPAEEPPKIETPPAEQPKEKKSGWLSGLFH